MSTTSQPSDKSSPTARSLRSPLDTSVLFPSISTLSPHGTAITPSPSFKSTPSEAMMPPLLGLRVEYNPELRKRDEWARLAPTLTTLGSFKGAVPQHSQKTNFNSPWDAWNADFSIELVYERQMLQAFDTHNHTHLLKRNALLLTPTRLDVHNRHQTAVTIRKFTEANRSSLGVIIYLMDTAVLGNEQINAVQSLGALHHYLSMGFAEPPQVLVVSDPSYLLDCISAYMKGISRANPTTVKIAGGKPLLFDTPGPSPFVSTIKDKQ